MCCLASRSLADIPPTPLEDGADDEAWTCWGWDWGGTPGIKDCGIGAAYGLYNAGCASDEYCDIGGGDAGEAL